MAIMTVLVASDRGPTVHIFTCFMHNTNVLAIYDNTRIQTLRKHAVVCLCARGLTDETEILKFLQHGTLVGLLPVPHPILIRKYQANSGTTMWFRTYLWGVIYLRSVATFLVCSAFWGSVQFSGCEGFLGVCAVQWV